MSEACKAARRGMLKTALKNAVLNSFCFYANLQRAFLDWEVLGLRLDMCCPPESRLVPPASKNRPPVTALAVSSCRKPQRTKHFMTCSAP
jgi:hypothetical protein